jgi:hypothetical protein
VLGKGSFGQVLKVLDYKTGAYRALKIIRNKKRFHHQVGCLAPACSTFLLLSTHHPDSASSCALAAPSRPASMRYQRRNQP